MGSGEHLKALTCWLWLGLLLWGCASPRGDWDVAALEAKRPELAAHSGHRLYELPPYWMPEPERAGLRLFLCRWPGLRPIRVSLPPDGSEAELETLRLALATWQAEPLGIRFEEAPSGPSDIEIRFAPVPEEPVFTGVGDTIVDCAVASGSDSDASSDRVDAQLVSASILLHRVLFDVAGRPAVLSRDQLLGAALHELGHALGHPGHSRSRDSIMTKASGEVARLARRVLAGGALDDATLPALYLLPSGVIVGALDLEAAQLEVYRRLVPRAASRGLRGPYVRVGDPASRLLWRRPDGTAAGSLVVRDWRSVLAEPARLELLPTPRAAALLRVR
jgi:hypothetical protein